MRRGRSTSTPTRAQQQRMDAIREIGCVAVPEVAHTYVTVAGDVYSDHPGNRWRGRLHRLKPSDNGRGYLRVRCGGRSVCVHLLVAAAFLGPKPAGTEVNHKDGIKTNNRRDNLEYVTRSENMKHCHRMGMAKNPSGADHHMSKLTAERVAELRQEYAALRVSGRLPDGAMKRLQAKYGMSDTGITCIARRKTWRDQP